MGCVSIGSRTYGDSVDRFYEFWSSQIDGNYAQGSWQTQHRDTVYLTPEQNYEKAINATISYLSGKFQQVYGRAMTRNDICGQESYKSPEQIAADIAAAAAFELQQQQLAAAEAANQLALKTSMLGSETATWQSQDAYSIALADANKAIDVFNNVTLPDLAEKTALTEQLLNTLPTGKTITESIKSNNMGLIILVAIVLVMLFFILRR